VAAAANLAHAGTAVYGAALPGALTEINDAGLWPLSAALTDARDRAASAGLDLLQTVATLAPETIALYVSSGPASATGPLVGVLQILTRHVSGGAAVPPPQATAAIGWALHAFCARDPAVAAAMAAVPEETWTDAIIATSTGLFTAHARATAAQGSGLPAVSGTATVVVAQADALGALASVAPRSALAAAESQYSAAMVLARGFRHWHGAFAAVPHKAPVLRMLTALWTGAANMCLVGGPAFRSAARNADLATAMSSLWATCSLEPACLQALLHTACALLVVDEGEEGAEEAGESTVGVAALALPLTSNTTVLRRACRLLMPALSSRAASSPGPVLTPVLASAFELVTLAVADYRQANPPGGP
jgi:hypothetical protein